MPGRPRNVEKLWKKSAKPTASPSSASAISTSAYGRGPEEVVGELVGVEHHLVGEVLVLGERADELDDRVEVGGDGGTDHGRTVSRTGDRARCRTVARWT